MLFVLGTRFLGGHKEGIETFDVEYHQIVDFINFETTTHITMKVSVITVISLSE